ncbi:MAG: hypothetical protein QXO94_00805 [Candidatus Bathyarchaeia archaeon]
MIAELLDQFLDLFLGKATSWARVFRYIALEPSLPVLRFRCRGSLSTLAYSLSQPRTFRRVS